MPDTTSPIKVSIVNDYEVIVQGLAAMLQPFASRVVVVETEAGGLPQKHADIALFDTFASRRRSLRRVDEIAGDHGITKVVLYTWDLPDEFAREIDVRSVDGVILKSTTGHALVDAIERIHSGEAIGTGPTKSDGISATLTEREREVLALLAQGATNREIAAELFLSFDTIKTHVRKVFTKLDVANRTQAAISARDYGLDLQVPKAS